jgi:hypothetical protein
MLVSYTSYLVFIKLHCFLQIDLVFCGYKDSCEEWNILVVVIQIDNIHEVFMKRNTS